eukprot:14477822-Alexandrium_andersonii.AAC.1
MEEAAAPSRPAGRSAPVPRSDQAQVGDPEVSALRAGGAALRAAPPGAQSCNLRGRRLSPIPSAGQGRFALRACWGPQPFPYKTSAPPHVLSMSCSEL